ncbi:uncharacterized protein LOC133466414 isoform X2 [Phyllopteryx taeniolatus]|uniref:uncharacterized protein LOC133466414 isoform X2 n=1 Tax=Phyllopteryx taeniolatus TaxID=161469 RepID=UPI002AD45A79|nr:uncharacterized protein LOC133466414 isoform X2 [Phyllopteryx taeniolatus]
MLSSFDVSADASLPLTASAAILACAVVLALICLRCRDDGSPGARDDGDDDATSCHLGVQLNCFFPCVPRHQFPSGKRATPTSTSHHATARLNSDLLSPFITASDRGSRRSRRSDLDPTESEQDFPESSTGDYLIVLPEGEAPGTDRSGASTPSSGEPHDYENVRERTQHSPTGCRTRTLTDRLTVCLTVLLNGLCSSDDRDYLNVIPLPQGGETPSSSSSSQNDDDDSDDSDGEGKYVNEASVSTVKFCKLSVQTSRQSHAASIS